MGLDTVEMVMQWEEAFGIEIPDADAERLRTPRAAIDYLCARLGVPAAPGGSCLSMRAFHQLRNAIGQNASVARASIRPRARLNDVVRQDRRKTWSAICKAGGWKSLTGPAYLPGFGFFNHTISDVSTMLLARNARVMRQPGEAWTRSQIRCVVHASITDTVGARDFGDDDRLVDLA